MFPILQVGPLAIQTPGLAILLGLWIGLTVAERFAGENKVNPDKIYNLTLVAMIFGIGGARLVYAARFPAAFSANPASLVSLNPGLLDLAGGIFTGLIAAVIYGQRTNLPFWRTLDALTPALAVGNIAIGLSQLAAGTAYGAPTDLPWGIPLWGANRHPSQVYNILAGVIILALAWPARPWHKSLRKTPGASFLVFLSLTAGAHLFLEAFRGESAILPNGIRIAQVISWVILGASLWGFNRLHPGREDQGSLRGLQGSGQG
jgi:prolipoprotein diacylglyceryltransferase